MFSFVDVLKCIWIFHWINIRTIFFKAYSNKFDCLVSFSRILTLGFIFLLLLFYSFSYCRRLFAPFSILFFFLSWFGNTSNRLYCQYIKIKPKRVCSATIMEFDIHTSIYKKVCIDRMSRTNKKWRAKEK